MAFDTTILRQTNDSHKYVNRTRHHNFWTKVKIVFYRGACLSFIQIYIFQKTKDFWCTTQWFSHFVSHIGLPGNKSHFCKGRLCIKGRHRVKCPDQSIWARCFPTKIATNIARIANATQVTLWLSITKPQCHDSTSQFISNSQLCHKVTKSLSH